MESRFAGKVALVTGSSSGMGRATAILLAQQGAKVTITGRNAERLQETKAEILKTSKRQDNEVLIVQTNLVTEEGQNELISKTIAHFGRLDILVNAAGGAFTDPTNQRVGALQDVGVLDQSWQIHLRTIVTLTQKAFPHLKESKGEIVNISAIGPPHGDPKYVFDSVPKAALDQFTRCIAVEFIKSGVRVNSVSPGLVRTGYATAMGLPAEAFEKMISFFESHHECVPLGHVAHPSQIAEIIAFLADRKTSGYILGQSIVADGGSTLVMGMDAHDLNAVMFS